MRKIVVTLKDGTKHKFDHCPRVGGSYTLQVQYEGGFAIIVDEWGNETAFPACDIQKVDSFSENNW